MKRLEQTVLVFTLILVSLGTFAFMIASQTLAQTGTPIELKFATIFPPTQPFSLAAQHWIDKIEKETGGGLKIKPYWSGTLISAREGLLEATRGSADIIHFAAAYEKTGLNLIKGQAGFYQGSAGPEVDIKVFWQLWDKYPELLREIQGLKLLGLGGIGNPLRLMTIKPVRNLADLKGMRIKAPQEALATLKTFGIEGVVIPMPDAFENLQKGIIQGLFASPETYKSMRFAEIVKHETNLMTNMGALPAYVMPPAIWNKLPADIQKVLDTNRIWLDQETIRMVDNADKEGSELAKKQGFSLFSSRNRISRNGMRHTMEKCLRERENWMQKDSPEQSTTKTFDV